MDGRMDRKQLRLNVRPEWILSLFLVLSIVTVYYPVVSFEFVNFDDNLYVTDNIHVKDGLSIKSVIWAFKTDRASNWHPLTWISHMLDCELYGLDSGMHHASSLIIHTINCLLLFWVLTRITGAVWQSAIVAALFGLHPINVDSVVWIAERKNILSTLFCMLTLLAYSYYVKKPRICMYMLALLLFALGLMAKPIIVSLPFALLLLDYWPLKRLQSKEAEEVGNAKTEAPAKSSRSLSLLILEKVPFILLASMSIAVSYIIVQQNSILVTTEMRSLPLRIANAAVTYLIYIEKMFWPVNLTIFYPYPKIIPIWKTTVASLLLLGASIYSIQQRKRRPYVGIGWYWYLVTLLPFIGQLQAGLWPAMADRWAYLPLIGLFICITWAGREIISKIDVGRGRIGIVTLLILTVLASRTWFQIQHWRNSVTLFEHALASTSDNYVIHNNLANVLEWKGKTDEAKAHYLEALRINPEFLMARYNFGNLLKSEGRITVAIEQYREVLRMNPDHAPTHNNLATALISVAEIEKVIAYGFKFTKRPKDSAAIRNQLKSAQRLRDMLDEAIFHFNEALRITPDSDFTSKNIKQALMFRKKIDKVVSELQDARHISHRLNGSAFRVQG